MKEHCSMEVPVQHKHLTANINKTKEPLLYNSMLVDNYIRMVKTRYPEIDINEVLKKIKVSSWEVTDPSQWLTQRRYNAFYYELKKHFKQPRPVCLAREAGRFAGTQNSKRLLREAIYALMSPTRVYDIFDDIARRYSRASDFTSQRIGKNKHRITITYKEEVRPQPFQCETYKGYLEAVFFLFENKWPKIEHPQCHFKNDGCCVYHISWPHSTPQILNRIRNHLILTTIAGAGLLFILNYFSTAMGTLAIGSMTCLSISLMSEFIQRRNILKRIKHQRYSPKEKVEGYERFYHLANLFNEISHHLNKHTNFREVLEKLSQILRELAYERGIIFVLDQNHDFVLFSRSFGLETDLAAHLKSAIETNKRKFHNTSPDLIKPQVINAQNALPRHLPEPFELLLQELHEMIYIPMIYKNKKALLGFFIVENHHFNQPLMASDISLLTTLAAQTALSILNITAFKAMLRNEQLKNEFTAIASHELRTPIQIILLALEEVQLSIPEKIRQDLAVEIEAMGESARQLEHIINKIIEIRKLEANKNKINFQTVTIKSLIKTLKMETAHIIVSRGHRIKYNFNNLKNLGCDPELIIRVLANMINNAAKYTPTGGCIELTFKKTNTDIIITCLDNGIGIPKQFQNKIFMKFYQVEKKILQDKSGCGLGLFLCQEIIKKHGGYINVESPLRAEEHPGLALGGERKGTKFSLHLKPKQGHHEK